LANEAIKLSERRERTTLSRRRKPQQKDIAMGDKSPKSKNKIASQKQNKSDHVDKLKKAEIARGQLAKAKIASSGKK
jgi:hypothetical protein